MSSGKKRTVGDTLLKTASGASPAKAPNIVSVSKHRLLGCKGKTQMKKVLRNARAGLARLDGWVEALGLAKDDDMQTSMEDFLPDLPSGETTKSKSDEGSGSTDPFSTLVRG